MPKFTVTVPYVSYVTYQLEAANVAEAIKIAEQGESKDCRSGDSYDNGEVIMDRPRYVCQEAEPTDAWYTPDGTFMREYQRGDNDNPPTLLPKP